MAIAFDSVDAGASATASSVTFSHTMTGSDTISIVGFYTDTPASYTGVTHDGAAMTYVGDQALPFGATGVRLYYKLSPTTGATNIVATLSTSNSIQAIGVSYTGVQATNVHTKKDTEAGPNTSQTITVTTTEANEWLVAAFANDTETMLAGADTTWRGSENSVNMLDSGGARAAGSNSLTATISTGGEIGSVVVSLIPGSQGGGAANHWLLMGV